MIGVDVGFFFFRCEEEFVFSDFGVVGFYKLGLVMNLELILGFLVLEFGLFDLSLFWVKVVDIGFLLDIL